MGDKKVLKKGYTTGVHTSFAFLSALNTFLSTSKLSISKTNKNDNDDLDVTKGCQIVVTISHTKDDLLLNNKEHKPYILDNNNYTLEIYAGVGVGVVTKDGLKPPKNYPAINPVPLEAIANIYQTKNNIDQNLYCSISVTNGETIAKQTANAKVGVVGGISILGSTGWVKPISASAYIHSIDAELNYAKANNYDTIVFTLGNSAYKKAIGQDNSYYIVEIGNFIYDGIKLAVEKEFKNIELWLGIGKAVKIAQGFKNTHNRFGSIDFNQLQNFVNIDISGIITVKGIRELLGDDTKKFDDRIVLDVKNQLYSWFNKDIKIRII